MAFGAAIAVVGSNYHSLIVFPSYNKSRATPSSSSSSLIFAHYNTVKPLISSINSGRQIKSSSLKAVSDQWRAEETHDNNEGQYIQKAIERARDDLDEIESVAKDILLTNHHVHHDGRTSEPRLALTRHDDSDLDLDLPTSIEDVKNDERKDQKTESMSAIFEETSKESEPSHLDHDSPQDLRDSSHDMNAFKEGSELHHPHHDSPQDLTSSHGIVSGEEESKLHHLDHDLPQDLTFSDGVKSHKEKPELHRGHDHMHTYSHIEHSSPKESKLHLDRDSPQDSRTSSENMKLVNEESKLHLDCDHIESNNEESKLHLDCDHIESNNDPTRVPTSSVEGINKVKENEELETNDDHDPMESSREIKSGVEEVKDEDKQEIKEGDAQDVQNIMDVKEDQNKDMTIDWDKDTTYNNNWPVNNEPFDVSKDKLSSSSGPTQKIQEIGQAAKEAMEGMVEKAKEAMDNIKQQQTIMKEDNKVDHTVRRRSDEVDDSS